MSEAIRIIKKYPNRRLYDTTTSIYITLADVKKLVLDNIEFKIEDAKTKDDLTRSILLQIILEEEGGDGVPMFSSDVLSKIIRFYGNAMQGMMGSYLERNIQLFSELQKKMQEQSQSLYGGNKASQDLWNQFMAFQGPAMQSLVSSYMDQSRSMFLQMQEKVQNQTRNMFTGFGFPGYQATGEEGTSSANEAAGKSPEGERKS